MKHLLNYFFAILLLASFCSSCLEDQIPLEELVSATDSIDSIDSIDTIFVFNDLVFNDLFDDLFEADTLEYDIRLDSLSTITTPKGLEINFPPAVCQGFCNPYSASIDSTRIIIKIVELYKRSEMLFGKTTATTMATATDASSALVSAVNFHFDISKQVGQNTQNINLAENSGVTAKIKDQPDTENYKELMKHFRGTNSIAPNLTNWRENSFGIVQYSAPQLQFTITNIRNSWNNCAAKYVQLPDNKTLNAKVAGISNYENTRIYFISDDFTTVALLNQPHTTHFSLPENSLPNNAHGKILAINLDNNQLKFGYINVTLTDNNIHEITIQNGTKQQLKQLVQSWD